MYRRLIFIFFAFTTLLVAQAGRTSKSDPVTTCKYKPDHDPPQIGPGKQTDGDYDFAYVSDYEANDQIYRRRICNSTKHRVWFDWGITALKGWCDTDGVLANEIPYPSQPKTGDGPLLYDFRDTPTRAFEYQPLKNKGILRSLWSLLSGYVRSGDKLVPVTVSFGSEYRNNQFSYIIENRSNASVTIYWKDFSEYWRKRQPDAYSAAFKQQAKEGILAGSADTPTVTVGPDRKSFWVFTVEQLQPEGQYSEVEIHTPGIPIDPKKPDLAGQAALYLPAKTSPVSGGK